MKLAQLLEGVSVTKMFQTMFGRMVVTHDAEVHRIQYDSRRVVKQDCFVAIRGTASDGHRFIERAISEGAIVVVLEDDAALPDSFFMHTGVIKVVVPDSRKALALMAANYYGRPSTKLKLVGVTGTNGKTTTTHIVKSILEAAGEKVGLVGTIEYSIGSKNIPASHTTPESLELNELFAEMLDADCSSVSMEVSSHALDQSRVFGLDFDVAVFTNLTQDHLDYHGTMEKYFTAKRILFDSLKANAAAVVNADDAWGNRIVSSIQGRRISYGINSAADIRSGRIDLSMDGTKLVVEYAGETTTITSPLVGRFNVYNVLAAYSAAVALDIPTDAISRGIANVKNVKGRFERISSPKGWTAIVDYAHTPDALEKCLRTIHDVLPERNRGSIITVFGAGGDRDKTKRPFMGKVASELSNRVIVTSDNPRTEDPEKIIDDILVGIVKKSITSREVDRRRAIETAVKTARRGDVVLIAGKGHEDYQVIGKEKIHFSDREVVESLL